MRAAIVPGLIESTYRALRIPDPNSAQTLEMWLPLPHGDLGRTGPIASMVLFPFSQANVEFADAASPASAGGAPSRGVFATT